VTCPTRQIAETFVAFHSLVLPSILTLRKILQAVSRKVSISPSINWEEIAESTEGFSGADLQALVYNAHLEVVHSSIASDTGLEKTESLEERPIEYVILGGREGKSVASRAEESAIQRRVNYIWFVLGKMWLKFSP
jgi:peroxin-1